MAKVNKDTRNFTLKVLKYSNNIAILAILLSLYLCYTHETWMYVVAIATSSIYLGWLTCQYIRTESDQCHWRMRSLQYDCQIASLNSRLSILSNVVITIFGIGFAVFMTEYVIKRNGITLDDHGKFTVSFMAGIFKLLMLYIVADKIHTSQLIISILRKYTQSMRHLTLDLDKAKPSCRFPIIYVDGKPISHDRYGVTIVDGVIGVTFTPVLSLNEDSLIEYELVAEDAEHVIGDGTMCKEADHVACLFKCRAVVRKRNEPAFA